MQLDNLYEQRREESMSIENENDKKEIPDTSNKDTDVQGYAYCDASKARCLNDCNNNTTPFLSSLN